MTASLGTSAFYHDSAAALVVDGTIVAAAQEERFTRVKHDHAFPARAVEYCLKETGLRPEPIDFVGFYDKPLLNFERLLETYLAHAPAGFPSFLRATPLWLKQKVHLPREMRNSLHGTYKKRFIFTEHHESHAASAFFSLPRAGLLLCLEFFVCRFGTGILWVSFRRRNARRSAETFINLLTPKEGWERPDSDNPVASCSPDKCAFNAGSIQTRFGSTDSTCAL